MVVPSVVESPVVVPEPPPEVLVAEAVWSPVPVAPPAPVVSLLVEPSVLPVVVALVLLTVVLAPVVLLVAVALAVTEPVVPEPVVLAAELVRLVAESDCDVGDDSEPHAAARNANRTTVIDNDALFIAPPPFRMDATDTVGHGREKR